jgi:hypothetical protein
MMLENEGASQLTNGKLFRNYSSNTQFLGVSNQVALDGTSNRLPLLTVRRADNVGNEYDVLKIDCDNVTFQLIIHQVANNFWLNAAGPPLDEPICGFTGALCDNRPYYFGGAALLLIILIAICALFARQRL